MRYRSVLGLIAVAGVAFIAGRLGLAPPSSTATAQEHAGMEMDEEMQKWMDAGTPGEHHKHLDKLAGTWSGEFKIWMEPGAPPMISKGTIKREWVLDGHYLRENVEASSEWGSFHGLGYVGFNKIDGVYEFTWMDSMSTAILNATGTYDADKGVLTTYGSHRSPDGQKMVTWGTLDMSDPDRHVYTEYHVGADGKKVKAFEGVTERQ